MFGITRISAMSSIIWWDAPSSPNETPPCEAQIFTGSSLWAMPSRIWSYARPVAKIAKVDAYGRFPVAASPQAIDIMFASAAPTLKKRSGNASPNFADWVETERSASSATTSSCASPSSTSAAP